MVKIMGSCLVLAFVTLGILGFSSSPVDSQTSFSINMPLELSDIASSAFGLIPFGVHVGDHAVDGHPGWDIEYQIGASVRAAADGIVQSIFADAQVPDKTTVQISHTFNNQNYRTVYTNIGALALGIAQGVQVTAGQPIGIAASQTQTIGTNTVTYAAIHFQLDDFSQNSGLTNVHAVSPITHLNASGRVVFAATWIRAAYNQELTEPFATNPRDIAYPLTRTWLLQGGGLAARIDFKRADVEAIDHEYTLFDGNGVAIETGTVSLDPLATPLSTLDLQPKGQATRLGVYNIIGGTMLIDWGLPGAPRPSNLSRASVYHSDAPEELMM